MFPKEATYGCVHTALRGSARRLAGLMTYDICTKRCSTWRAALLVV